MPTKILCRNIQNFTYNKIDPATSEISVVQTVPTSLPAVGTGTAAAPINRVNVSALGQASLMYNSPAQIAMLPPCEQDDAFRQPFNFGKLGPVPGTSDHMAIYLEL